MTLLALAAFSFLGSQTPVPATPGPVLAAVTPEYERVKGFLLRSAEDTPEELYAFKPTPGVRSFGQIIGHVAEIQFVFCAAAKNEANPQPEEFEKTKNTKAELVKSLRASFDYCDSAYRMTDAQVTTITKTKDWGERAPLQILVLNISHDNEHYGNLVTYLRLKGLVPPSSQPRK